VGLTQQELQQLGHVMLFGFCNEIMDPCLDVHAPSLERLCCTFALLAGFGEPGCFEWVYARMNAL